MNPAIMLGTRQQKKIVSTSTCTDLMMSSPGESSIAYERPPFHFIAGTSDYYAEMNTIMTAGSSATHIKAVLPREIINTLITLSALTNSDRFSVSEPVLIDF